MGQALKICVVTGSRAEYGLLKPVVQAIGRSDELSLQIAVTGAHLDKRFGETYKIIEQDGFTIDANVPVRLNDDSAKGIAVAAGGAVAGFAEAFERLTPDLVLVLGDRYEIFAAAQAALFLRIPLAHIAGGDRTEGAIDEALRHSITKMAHIHFVTNEPARRRVCQLGENPDNVYMTGNPGLDVIRTMPVMERDAVERALGFKFRDKNLLVTFHPVTLEADSGLSQCRAMLDALESQGEDTGIIITLPNADTCSQEFFGMQKDFADRHDNVIARVSLGHELYMNTIRQVDAVVGNSSSGLLEVPSFQKPTVNIGDRQRGRLTAASVIDCAAEKEAILKAIAQACDMGCGHVENPYGDGHATEKIIKVLTSLDNPKALLKKEFHDIDHC